MTIAKDGIILQHIQTVKNSGSIWVVKIVKDLPPVIVNKDWTVIVNKDWAVPVIVNKDWTVFVNKDWTVIVKKDWTVTENKYRTVIFVGKL